MPLQNLANAVQELPLVERLLEEVDRAGPEGANRERDLRVSSQHDDGEPRRHGLELLAEREAAHVRVEAPLSRQHAKTDLGGRPRVEVTGLVHIAHLEVALGAAHRPRASRPFEVSCVRADLRRCCPDARIH